MGIPTNKFTFFDAKSNAHERQNPTKCKKQNFLYNFETKYIFFENIVINFEIKIIFFEINFFYFENDFFYFEINIINF